MGLIRDRWRAYERQQILDQLALVPSDLPAAMATDAEVATAIATLASTTATEAELASAQTTLNTAISAKQDAAAAAAALALKAPLASPAFTGTPTKNGSPVQSTTDIAGAYVAKPTRRAVAQVSGNQVDVNASVSDMVIRYPLRVPLPVGVSTARWRYCIHTGGSKSGTVNAWSITVKGVALGKHLFSATGGYTGNFVSAPATALSQFTTPADGSIYRSDWVTDPTLQLSGGIDHLISMGWTGTAGQSVPRTGAQMFYRSNPGESNKWADTVLSPGVLSGVGYYEQWIEYEVPSLGSLVFCVGDSLTAGYFGEGGTPGAWPELAAQAGLFHVINGGVTGSLASEWAATGTDLRWSKWGLGTTLLPDAAVIAIGSNDCANSVAMATTQANIMTIMGYLRAAGIPRIYLATVIPRGLTATADAIRIALNNWLRTCPNGAAGCFEFDRVVADGPARTVTDGATNTNTTVTSATLNASAVDDIGRTITGTGIPAGATITAVASPTSVTISAAATATATGVTLTIGKGQSSLRPDIAYTDGIHMYAGGYKRMSSAAQIASRTT